MNIITKYLPKTFVYGKQIGVGKNNGIQVYKRISNYKNAVTLTSFTPDGEMYKQITTTRAERLLDNSGKTKLTIKTVAKNFKDKTITLIEKLKIATKHAVKINPYNVRTKTSGFMDGNGNIRDNAKKIIVSLNHDGVVKTKNKTVSYPNGSKIFRSTKKDRGNILEYVYAQDLQMPGGQIVNRIITRESKMTPFGERIIAYNGRPGQDICNITDCARTNF